LSRAASPRALWAGIQARYLRGGWSMTLKTQPPTEPDGMSVRANRMEERKAMAGSPDAVPLCANLARRSFSPSCSWLSAFRITD